jgi:hypothetical protein
MLHALYPEKMGTIDRCVLNSLGDLVVNDYTALYKESAKNPRSRPTRRNRNLQDGMES